MPAKDSLQQKEAAAAASAMSATAAADVDDSAASSDCPFCLKKFSSDSLKEIHLPDCHKLNAFQM
jgi:hypothetical protein